MIWKSKLLLVVASLKKRRRFWIKNMGILSVSAILIFFCGSVSKSFDVFLNDYLLGSPAMRTLQVIPLNERADDTCQRLVEYKSKNLHVIDIFQQPDGVRMQIINADEITGFSKNKESSAFGQFTTTASRYYDSRYKVDGNWIEEGQSNVGIVPKHFSMNAVNDLQQWNMKQEYIDGAKLIGKTIDAHYYTYRSDGYELVPSKEFRYSFRVIGTYDNIKAVTPASRVILPYEDIIIIDKLYEQYDDATPDQATCFFVMVDDIQHVSEVEAELNSMFGSGEIPVVRAGKEGALARLAKSLSIFSKFLGISIAVICLFIITLVYAKAVHGRSREIGIYKAIGYTNRDITFCLLLEIIMASVITFAVAIVFSIVILVLLYGILQVNGSLFMRAISLSLSLTDLLISLLLCVFVPLFSGFVGISRIIKMEPKDVLYKNS